MPDLPKRTLGRTGLDVTVLGYGAMELRGAPRGRDVSDEQAERILNAALDAGINFVDTSIDYGVAEERIGKLHLATGATSTSWRRRPGACPGRWSTTRRPPARMDAFPTSSRRRTSCAAWSRACRA